MDNATFDNQTWGPEEKSGPKYSITVLLGGERTTMHLVGPRDVRSFMRVCDYLDAFMNANERRAITLGELRGFFRGFGFETYL